MTGHHDSAHLVSVLTHPVGAESLTTSEWSGLIATARIANLLGILAERLARHGISPPASARRHLDGARQLSARQRRSVLWEAHNLDRALATVDTPVVLLKGAAYVLTETPISLGRLFGDIDILVQRAALGNVELRLMVEGWASAKSDPYDQRYYREWMHEIPPMTHMRRGTVLDVHHTILPLTAKHTPDVAQIFARSHALPGFDRMRAPCPEDMVIHCITHFVHEGEFQNGLRDLCDIDGLLRFFGLEPVFWDRLTEYTLEHDLARPISQGLQLVEQFFGTPIPSSVKRRLEHNAPPRLFDPLIKALYSFAIRPDSRTPDSIRTSIAKYALYVRAHSLRMPPLTLLRHLSVKAMRKRKQPRERGPAVTEETR